MNLKHGVICEQAKEKKNKSPEDIVWGLCDLTIEAAAFSNWRVSWRFGHVDIAHGASGKDEDGLSFLRTESASLAASLTCKLMSHILPYATEKVAFLGFIVNYERS